MAQPPIRKREIGLTGRVRRRTQLFTGLQILQVEIRVRHYRIIRSEHDKITTEWRDASEHDLYL